MHYLIESLTKPHEADTLLVVLQIKYLRLLKRLSNVPHTTQLINGELGRSDHHVYASNQCPTLTPIR